MTITENDLLAALAEEYKMQYKQPGEFSVNDLVAQTGGKHDTVRDFLNKKVQDGVLTSRPGVVEGKTRVTVYRAVK